MIPEDEKTFPGGDSHLASYDGDSHLASYRGDRHLADYRPTRRRAVHNVHISGPRPWSLAAARPAASRRGLRQPEFLTIVHSGAPHPASMRGTNGFAPWPFVGREQELATFTHAWTDRCCRVFVIGGPTGVGRTSFAERCLSIAERGGLRAIRVHGSAARQGTSLAATAHLIPAGTDFADPTSVLTAARNFLTGPGRRGCRIVVLVDDVHLLDTASTVLLRQLVDLGVIRLIATTRGGVRGDAARDLTRVDPGHRVDLCPFSAAATAATLRSWLGGPVSWSTTNFLHDMSDGSVSILRDLAESAVADGLLVTDGVLWELAKLRIPARARLTTLLTHQLHRVRPDGWPVLELLALFEPLPLRDVESVASPHVLADLEDTDLIQVCGDLPNPELRLAHPPHRKLIRQQIPLSRRTRLLDEQLIRARARGDGDVLPQLAEWHLAATGTAHPRLLAQAASVCAHAQDYRRVVTFAAALPDHQLEPRLRLLYGATLMLTGDRVEAGKILNNADLSNDYLLDGVRAHAFRLFFGQGLTDEALLVTKQAQARTGDPDVRRALRLDEAAMRVFAGEPTIGLAMLDSGPSVPASSVDTDGGSTEYTAAVRATALTLLGRSHAAIALTEMTHPCPDSSTPYHPCFSLGGTPADTRLLTRMLALTDLGQFDQARQAGEELLIDSAATHNASSRVWATCFLGRLEWLAGHPDDARRWYAESLSLIRRGADLRPLRLVLAGLAAAAAMVGRTDEAQRYLTEMTGAPAAGLLAGEDLLGHAWLSVSRGQLAEARLVLLDAVEAARAGSQLTSESLLLTDLARLGAPEVAAPRLAELATTCDGPLTASRASLAAALTTGHADTLMDVAERLGRLGSDLLAAEAAGVAATALRRAGQLREATAAATTAHGYAAQCQDARTPLLGTADTRSASLTQRESEIARLAASGRTSRDIAATLRLSARTIDNHLHRAYQKLGVTTRQDLARVLMRAS